MDLKYVGLLYSETTILAYELRRSLAHAFRICELAQ